VATKQLAGATIEEQTRQSLHNSKAIVEAAGGRLDDVVQVTVLLAIRPTTTPIPLHRSRVANASVAS
jgi:enamine deaminase RidA (YjgF/YER057c/UK114 family)